MNRDDLQKLATDRLADAKVLLMAKRWAGAYYLAGYAVECGLKSCIIAHLRNTDQFPEKRFSEQCWTHNLTQLVGLAGLKADLDNSMMDDAQLRENWETVKNWDESSRYERTLKNDSEDFYEAIVDKKHGVFSWIKALVGLPFEEGRRFIEHINRAGFPVTAAAWVKENDGDVWFLYLVTPLVNEHSGRRSAYRRMHEAAPEIQKVFALDPMEVKVMGPNDPVAQAIIAARDSDRSRHPIRWYSGYNLGPLEIDEAYLYPATMTS